MSLLQHPTAGKDASYPNMNNYPPYSPLLSTIHFTVFIECRDHGSNRSVWELDPRAEPSPSTPRVSHHRQRMMVYLVLVLYLELREIMEVQNNHSQTGYWWSLLSRPFIHFYTILRIQRLVFRSGCKLCWGRGACKGLDYRFQRSLGHKQREDVKVKAPLQLEHFSVRKTTS